MHILSWIFFITLPWIGTSFLEAELCDCESIVSSIEEAPEPDLDLKKAEDAYLEGYIQSSLNFNYYEFKVLVYVENGDVYLYNLPKNALIKSSIMHFVKNLAEVASVTEVGKFPAKKLENLEKRERRGHIKGSWFPQQTVLYPPMLANPRETMYSATYRIGDSTMGKQSIAISLGDNFPIFRWRNVLRWKGDLQVDIQSGIWSVFKMDICQNGEISALMNTDYLVGFPLSYAFDNWSFRARLYHVSSHLGDEFMAMHSGVTRLNPSMEALDFFTSFQINMHLRTYAGLGWVFHSDKTYCLRPPFYFEWGGEARMCPRKFCYHRLHGSPFLAVYFRNWQTNRWRFDATYMMGYEISGLQGIGRKMRIFINYHHGYSEGQFFKNFTSFTGIGFSWGF